MSTVMASTAAIDSDSDSDSDSENAPLEIVLITGMSGSGKSVVLKALEDAAYYCVDNLPPALLEACVVLQQSHGQQRLAIVMDVRSAAWLVDLPVILNRLRTRNLSIKLLFLDATTDTLVRRYSETRRKHPLSRSDVGEQHLALAAAIRLERELLGPLREQSQVIDTSTLRAAQLQTAVKELVLAPDSELTLVFQSFAFKRSLPVDADYVFDVRVLPNPYYEPGLQALTGRDDAVATFLQAQPETWVMFDHIRGFLTHWLPLLARNHRGYVTVAIGCTGGQHRSVYLVERLVEHFSMQWVTLKRHRELHDRS